MSIMERSVKIFSARKAAREIKKEIEQAGLVNLKFLAERNISIVGTYLNGCSPEKKTEVKRGLASLLAMGVTMDMLLEQLGQLMPELAPLLVGREAYKKSELQEIEKFIQEGKPR
jgi:hypothetical protein